MKPPRGAVRITSTGPRDDDRTKFVAHCSNCGWDYSNFVRSDVETHKRWHQCPDEDGAA